MSINIVDFFLLEPTHKSDAFIRETKECILENVKRSLVVVLSTPLHPRIQLTAPVSDVFSEEAVKATFPPKVPGTFSTRNYFLKVPHYVSFVYVTTTFFLLFCNCDVDVSKHNKILFLYSWKELHSERGLFKNIISTH